MPNIPSKFQKDPSITFTNKVRQKHYLLGGGNENVLAIWWQAVARQHISMAESLRLLLAAVWREIARWKDVEKRAITAQVTVEPATLDALDQMYEFTDCH